MVLTSLKTQDTTSNKNLSRVRDDVDEIGTQAELIVNRNSVTQTDPVIIKSRSKNIQCRLLPGNCHVRLCMLTYNEKNKSNLKQRKLPFNVSHVGS